MTKPLGELWADLPPQHRVTVLGNGRSLDYYEPSEEDGFVIGVNMAPLVFPVHLATSNDRGSGDDKVEFEPFADLSCIRVRWEGNYLGGEDEDYYLFKEGRDIPYELTRGSSSVAIYIAHRLGARQLRLVGMDSYHDPFSTAYARCLDGVRFKSTRQLVRRGPVQYAIVNKTLTETLESCGFIGVEWFDQKLDFRP